MEITLVEHVGAQIKTPCVACGLWDRPGEPAFFIDGDCNEWICADCAAAGADGIRQGFRMQAAKYRRVAEAYDTSAEEEILINELDLQRYKDALCRAQVAEAAEMSRIRRSWANGDYEEPPF